jgi:NAD(P) transhydrogenase
MPDLERFDMVVIGSGPAGEKGAAQAAYFGKRVVLVERSAVPGGASVHTGTLPSKTLRETALYLTGFRRAELYGMSVRLNRRKNLRQLMGRLRSVIGSQTRQILRNLERHRIEVVTGQARFLDSKTVGVFDGDGREIRRLGADVILIATGSSPMPPPGIAPDDPDIVDSDGFLDLDRIPDRLVVVGGGVIGCEYASIFAALGTRITLLEARERLLGFVDAEIASALSTALERMGCEILLGDAVESIERVPGRKRDALRLRLRSGRALKADKVLFSAGRRGNTDGLGLEAAGVAAEARGRIAVDESFRTRVPGIYAAGDVTGFPALAATSMEQGRVAACRAFGIPFKTTVSPLLPYGIYTIPEISMVGSTEEELESRGVAYQVGRSRYENNARGQITGDPDGFVKLIFDPESKKLLGAHILGGNATELIHIPQMVMARDGGLQDFLDAVFNFPTLSECFKYAAYDGLQRLAHQAGEISRLTEPYAPPACSPQDIPPAGRSWFLGVDLTDPHARNPRPVAVATMDRWRRVRFRTWTFEPSGRGLLPPEIVADGYVLAIDGPQGLASAGRRQREAERLLRTAGRSADTFPAPGAPYAGFIAGSVALFASLRAAGLCLLGEAPPEKSSLLETYPADLWRKWSGRRIPKKSSPAGRRARHEILRGFGVDLPVGPEAITHDELDAAAAALLAYLWATGEAKLYGPPPVFDEKTGVIREGPIVSL